MKNHPHDEFFKYLFSIQDAAKEFLLAFLPAHVLACLDLETLAPDETAYITPDLAAVYSDKVFRCRIRAEGAPSSIASAAIVILLEHKSFAPSYPHFQLNEYRQRVWATLIQNREKPVMVLPIILFHGTDLWKRQALFDYFEGLPTPLRPYLGSFEYILVHLPSCLDAELLNLRLGFLAYGLLTMKHSSNKTYLLDQFKTIFKKGDEFLKTEDGRNYIEHLFVYYARISEIAGADLKDKIIENSKNMQAELLSTYDKIKLEGKIEGKLEGKLEAAHAFAEKMILHFPSWPDERIADLSGASLKEIAKLRRKLSAKKRSVLPKKKANGPNGSSGTIDK